MKETTKKLTRMGLVMRQLSRHTDNGNSPTVQSKQAKRACIPKYQPQQTHIQPSNNYIRMIEPVTNM